MSEEKKIETSPLNTCKTQLEAVEFLNTAGYKVGKSTFNDHYKAGLIFTNEEGLFRKDALLGYAVNNLKAIAKQGDVQAHQAQVNKTASNAELASVRAERERIKLLKEQGAVMPIVEHEKALAARALFFTSEIKSFIHRKALEMIELVNGDEKKRPDLIYWWEMSTEDWIDSWSADREFIVKEDDEENEV